MSEILLALGVVGAGCGGLLAVAWWAERRAATGRSPSSSPFVYALSQLVFVSGWGLFGDVGSAARSGLGYAAINLAPALVLLFAGSLLRRLIRVKEAQRLTSVADLIATRYDKSTLVGALVTILLLVGLVPYVALQFQVLLGALTRVAGEAPARVAGPLLAGALILFTVLLGLRRQVPTERHPGVVAALALDGVLKLAVMAAAGAFAAWYAFDGPSDLFEQAARAPAAAAAGRDVPLSTWITELTLAAAAFLFLPRQFHVAVVENERESHLRTSMWLVPLLLLVLSLFPLPVALAALTGGLPAADADAFLLTLPLASGQTALVWLVLLAAVTATSGMVVTETMALATMASNHLVLPALQLSRRGTALRGRIREMRWVAAALLIAGAYGYAVTVGRSHTLETMGLASFVAVLQLAPAAIAGLYWRRANRTGALLGLLGGIGVWAWAVVLPILARSGAAGAELLERGPFGLAWLRPESLFGAGLEPSANAAFFSLLVNVTLLVLGSLLATRSDQESRLAARFAAVLEGEEEIPPPSAPEADIPAAPKRGQVERLFESFLGGFAAAPLTAVCFSAVKLPTDGMITIEQLAALEDEVERTLASAIGSAAARVALTRAPLLDPEQSSSLSRRYAERLARELSPAQLMRRVDYFEERNRLLAEEAHAQSCLANASASLAGSLDPATTALTAARLSVPWLVEASLLCVEKPTVAGPATEWWVHYADVDPAREQQIAQGLAPLTLDDLARPALSVRAGIPLWEPDDTPACWPAALSALGFRGTLCLPLVAGQRVVGVWALFCTPGSRFRHPRDLALAQELAWRSALAVDNAASFWRAQAAVRTRNELIAMASHELRTPLVPLLLQIQNLQRTLEQGRLTEEKLPRIAGLLAGAEGQLQRLADLIDRMLDASRLTNGKLRLEREQFDLAELTRDLAARHAAQAQRVGCELKVEARAAVVGSWDRLRLDQSVTNLLTNAFKYAPGKPVTVTVEERDGRVCVRVRDEGPGVAPADQERIFLPFERAASAQHFPGLGLGLFLARQIIEEHGGRLTLESVLGQGSTFVAELPLAVAPAEGAGAGQAAG